MKIKYDRETDVMMMELDQTAVIDHAEHRGNVIVHVDADDRPVLIEILDASNFLAGSLRASMSAETVEV
jgi:uncharacterized protein YuzE